MWENIILFFIIASIFLLGKDEDHFKVKITLHIKTSMRYFNCEVIV